MKNAHGVEPTQFMKREESRWAIRCDSECGPIFGCSDIYILVIIVTERVVVLLIMMILMDMNAILYIRNRYL